MGDRFLKNFKQEFNCWVGRTANTDQIVFRNRKIVELPTVDDLHAFFSFLNNERDKAKEELKNSSKESSCYQRW